MDIIGERTLLDLIDEQSEAQGSKTFLICESLEGEISEASFQTFRQSAFGMAAGLQALGVGKGERVFVFLRNRPDYVPLWFGICISGAILVPGNIYLTEHEVSYLLSDCQPAVIVTERRFEPIIRAAMAQAGTVHRVVLVDGEAEGGVRLAGDPDAFERVSLASGDIAEILYTSGTSSHPKGVMLTHANLLWCGIVGDGLTPTDRVFNNKPLFHANCQATVLWCLTVGATAIIGERYSASRYMAELVRHRATVCSLSGMLCRTLLNQPASELDTAHSVRLGRYAINISQDEIDAFVKRFRIPLRNGYGLSEAMVLVTNECGGPSTYPSIGRPAVGREVFIVDEENRPLPPGAEGEIVVRGVPGRDLMLGYHGKEEATAAAFEGGWLHTGDLGRMDEKGNFYFLGRRKDVIKRSGENISASEVEDVLAGHPGVRDVAVIGVPDPIRDQAVKAVVVAREPGLTAEELKVHCSARLAYFKVPEFFEFVDELPRNASGKILKRVLETAGTQ